MKSTWLIATAVALISSPVFAGAGEQGHGHAEMAEMGAGHGHGATPSKATKPARISRTINVTMHDTMRFDPPSINVKAGETIRFRLKNAGAVPHEMVIGAKEDLDAHAQTMRAGAGAAHGVGHGGGHGAGSNAHDESAGLLLQAGKRGELVYTFKQQGTIDFACLVPGHFEAGMVGKIAVN